MEAGGRTGSHTKIDVEVPPVYRSGSKRPMCGLHLAYCRSCQARPGHRMNGEELLVLTAAGVVVVAVASAVGVEQ